MPTKKPRVTFALSEEELAVIDKYRFDNHLKNQTQAILSLISIGLDTLDIPSSDSRDSENLSSDDRALLDAYHAADPKSRAVVDLVLAEYKEKAARSKEQAG